MFANSFAPNSAHSFANRLKLLIRAEAGPQIGTGHVLRMLTLGLAWQKQHGDVAFVAEELPNGLVQQIIHAGFEFYQIKSATGEGVEAREVVKICKSFQPDWIALDGVNFTDSYQRVIGSSPARMLVVDDTRAATNQYSDLVLNQHSSAQVSISPTSEINSFAPSGGPQILTGPLYALLRGTFSNQPNRFKRRSVAVARRILVSFAGFDPDHWTLRTLQVLSDLNRGQLVVDCIVGSDDATLASLSIFKAKTKLNLRLHRNVDRLETLAETVDFAIASTTNTCCELARWGVPTIAVSTDEQRQRIPVWMADSGAVVPVLVGSGKNSATHQRNLEAQLSTVIKSLSNQPSERKKISECGQRLIDGRGAERVANTMAMRCYQLRDVAHSDATLLWQWQNDPEVKSVSLVEPFQSADDHADSVQQKIADPNWLYWLAIGRNEQPIACISFQRSDSQTALISLTISQSMRGRGFGRILIKRAVEELIQRWPVGRIVAQVKPLNVASDRAFRHAGFSPTVPTTVNGNLANQLVLERSATGSKARQNRRTLKKSA